MAGRAGAAGGNQGDESIQLFFLLALLICAVVPWTLSVAWALLFPGRQQVQQAFSTSTEDGSKVRICQTHAMVAKREAQISKLTSRKETCTRGFVLRTAILLLLWSWLIYIAIQLNRILATSSLYADFDPYALLEVGRSSKKADIKKAFHKMSLKYHPDKNPEPAAAEKFIMVKKAFDALTDPVAKRNYEMYGNPDGPARIELGVALPTFSKEQQGPVLMLFVLGFILGVPLTVLFCCMGDGEGEKCPNGVLRQTMTELHKGMTKNTDLRGLQELLLAAAENASCQSHPDEAELLSALAAEVRPKALRTSAPKCCKAEVLYYAHIGRFHSKLTPNLVQDLDKLLPKWRTVAMGMADLAVRQNMWSTFLAALELNRCIVQALEPGASPILQAPHFDVDRVKAWKKGSKKGGDLDAFVAAPADERKKTLEALGFDAQQVLDVDEFVKVFPRMSIVDVSIDVEGEDGICKDDIARLRVRFRREQLAEGEAAGAAHTPLFPSAAVPDAWWVTFSMSGKPEKTRVVRVVDPAREVLVEMKFRVPSVGKCRYTVSLASEVYEGLTLERTSSYQANTAPPTRFAGGSDDEDARGGEKDDDDE